MPKGIFQEFSFSIFFDPLLRIFQDDLVKFRFVLRCNGLLVCCSGCVFADKVQYPQRTCEQQPPKIALHNLVFTRSPHSGDDLPFLSEPNLVQKEVVVLPYVDNKDLRPLFSALRLILRPTEPVSTIRLLTVWHLSSIQILTVAQSLFSGQPFL